MTEAFDAILFDADGVVQTTDEKWFYAMTELIGTADEERVTASSRHHDCARRRWPATPSSSAGGV